MNGVDQVFAVDGATARIEEFAAACRVQPDSITVFTLADVRTRSRKYALECDNASPSKTSGGKFVKLQKLSKMTQAKIDNELVASTCTGAMQILLPLMNLGPGGDADPSAAAEYVKSPLTISQLRSLALAHLTELKM